MKKKHTIVMYLIFAFLLTWVMQGFLWFSGIGLSSPITSIILTISMYIPTVAVLLTKKVNSEEYILGVSLKPKFKENIHWYLFAWLLLIAINIVGGIIYFCIFPEHFDPEMLKIKNIPLTQIALSMTVIPLSLTFLTVGEEIGWRGFLFPAIRKRSTEVQSYVICGFIWGIWHAPMIAMGYNFGTGYPWFPWLGILGMCLFCIALGVICTYVANKSGSIWPAALAHATNNATSSLPIALFFRKGIMHSSFIVGIITLIPMLFIAFAFMMISIHKNMVDIKKVERL